MRPQIKRRVQAQRKFAQGVYIPPQNNPLPARVDATLTPPKEDRNIIHNNLSAKNLLDIVSFQSMHTHSYPIVVLERMTPVKESPVQNSRDIPVKQTPTTSTTEKPTHRPRLKLTARNSTMCLRSRTQIPNGRMKPTLKKMMNGKRQLNLSKKMRQIAKPNLKHKQTKKPVEPARQCSTSDLDDETPLKYFKSNQSNREPIVSPGKATGLGSIDDVRVTRANAKSNDKPVMKRVKRFNLERADRNSSDTKKTQQVENNNIPAEDTNSPDKPIMKPVVSKTPAQNTNKPDKQNEPTTPSITEEADFSIQNINAFKEPAVPTRFFKASTVVSAVQKKNKLNQKTAISEKKSDPVGSEQQNRYYGSVGINQWLIDFDIHRSNDEEKQFDSFSVGSDEPMRLHYSPTPSVCPSESLRTVMDVVQASASDLEKGCKACSHCRRINKIQQISNLMQSSRRKENNDDVYEFDEDKANEEQTTPFCSNRKRRNSRALDVNVVLDPTAINVATDSTGIVADANEYHFYLDMLPDSSHVVQMTSIKQPNKKKRMMRTRLVPRSEAHITQDFSLIDYEVLLDQLLNILRVKKSASQDTTLESFTSIDNDDEPSTMRVHDTSRESEENNKTRKTSNENKSVTPTNKVKNISRPPRASNENGPEPSTSKAKKGYVAKPTNSPSAEFSTSKLNKTNIGRSSRLPGKSQSNDVVINLEPSLENDSSNSNLDSVDGAKLVEAPVYYMTEEDFTDPISFFEKITPEAAKFGLCKVVAPESFKPKCVLNDDFKFNVSNQYIARLYNRWGPAAREMSAMKAYLASQNVTFGRVPLLESLEVNLPKLYLVVQRHGGLYQVIEKKRWGRVAEEMRFSKGPNTEKMLDSYYVKYLLPYDTATNAERQHIMGTVEKCWHKKHRKLLEWALNPLHHQKKLLGESDTSEEETDDQTDYIMRALSEAEDCVVGGRSMKLSGFKRVANHANTMFLPHPNATPAEIEKEYWRLVLFGTDHVCVNSASIDTGASAYGFSKQDKSDPCGKHPWNLKMLSANSGNVLRSLDAVLGVTVPTLHLGMVFSTSCWHRDPHGLPWMEYMHEGPSKIWYGIPDEQSANFRKAVEALCPTSCQNKSIWLSSDITMIPPTLLREHNVSLSHAVQKPGEFIIVFPKAYSCSISTGFTVSESVYFATNSWLGSVIKVFKELRESCEPTTFSLEQLLIALGKDPRATLTVLKQVYDSLSDIIEEEIKLRTMLVQLKIQKRPEQHLKKRGTGAVWNVREQAECQVCRKTLYLSKVMGLTARKSSLCLVHAVQLLKTPKYRNADVSSAGLITFFNEKQLQEIQSAVQKRLADKLANTPHSSSMLL